MRKFVAVPCLLAALAGLSACGSTGLFNRARPDEMQVTRNAPLFVPPAARSAAEAAALSSAGRDTASPGIRSSVGDPQTNLVDKGATTRDILSAPEGDGQYGRAVAN